MPETDLNRELDTLRGDLAKLRADFAGVAEALKEAGQQRAGSATEGLANLLASLREELKGALDTAKDRSKKSVESVGHQIEERPLVSLLTAFGVGFILARLFERR